MDSQVSVIVPIYNAQDFLENAVNSALVHPYVGEVILVEDGSTDTSYDICLRLSEQIQRVVLLTHPHRVNRGAAASRNLGVERSAFSLIAFLDADDTYYPNRFSEAVSLLKNNPTVDACFGIVEINYSDNGRSKMMGFMNRDPMTSVLTYLLKGGYFHTNSITARKDFFQKVGFFDQACWPHEDTEMWIRMAAMGRLESISEPNPIAIYRIHGNNLSRVTSLRSKMEVWKNIYKKVFYLPIGLTNKILILRQFGKVWIRQFLHSK